jgi:hypothetical protein
LPRIEKLHLEHISTYSQRPEIAIDLWKGVTCFAGANGIGKSTLIALLMYGLTGAAPSQNRGIKEAGDYHARAVRETDKYFEGRIREADRSRAAITVQFLCGTDRYLVRRRFFSDREGITRYEHNGHSVSGNRDAQFVKDICSSSGLSGFDQFVFLAHFLSVFDESRYLLFWQPRALEHLLFVAFGEQSQSDEAELARRAMERAHSRVRNLQFEAKKVQDRLSALRGAPVGENNDADAALLRYDALQEQRQTLLLSLESYAEQAGAAAIVVAELATRLASLRDEYSAAFKDTVGEAISIEQHPASRALLRGDPCAICASHDIDTRARALSNIDRSICPLCDAPFVDRNSAQRFARLEDLDSDIQARQTELSVQTTQRNRILDEQAETNKKLFAVERELMALEQDGKTDIIRSTGDGQVDANNAIVALQINLQGIQADKARQLSLRERHRARLQALQRDLAERYAKFEALFVPVFQRLAEEFLGLKIVVRLKARATQISFSLDVAGTRRDLSSKLSESQRFFVDIALRMALVRFLAGDSGGELYIDTPEGSLDIAYEGRAGDMFAAFVRGGNDLVVTANINTSELLIRLAERCGRDRMELIRMTSWTQLSDVQIDEKPAFEKAYNAIEVALG